MATFQISQLAARTGVPATTLRFYEREGLLPAERSAGGYRVYDDGAVDRLDFIGAGKHLGLSLDHIRELLGVWESGLCVQVQERLRPLLQDGVASALRRVGELEAFGVRLRRALDLLDATVRPGPCDPSCVFLLREDVASSGGRPKPEEVALTEVPPEPAQLRGLSKTSTLELEPEPEPEPEPERAAETAAGLGVACSLSAVGREDQLGRWRRLLSSSLEVAALARGVRVTLPVAALGEAAAVAAAEQRCCPFFEFTLQLAGPVVHLQVLAPAGAEELVDDLLGELRPAR